MFGEASFALKTYYGCKLFFLKRPGELCIFILRGKRVDNPYIHPTIQVHTHAHPGITNYIHAGAKSEKLPGLDQKLTGIQW